MTDYDKKAMEIRAEARRKQKNEGFQFLIIITVFAFLIFLALV